MRPRSFATLLATAMALFAVHANAAPLPPTIEFEDGPVASSPITSGSLSFNGVTVTGAPLVGTSSQQVLQLGGSTVISGLFNPLTISATEFNLLNQGPLASVFAGITGTLAPLSAITWSIYLDPDNNPFGTGEKIASGSAGDPSALVSIGFFDPGTTLAESFTGPFSLTEVVQISAPAGETVSFNASASATVTATAVPEPGSLALLGVGLLGLGLIVPMWGRPLTVT